MHILYKVFCVFSLWGPAVYEDMTRKLLANTTRYYSVGSQYRTTLYVTTSGVCVAATFINSSGGVYWIARSKASLSIFFREGPSALAGVC